MLLKLIEYISKMLFTSFLKIVVIKLLVFKTYRNPLVEHGANNMITIKNITKLIGEIYVVGFFIGNNLEKLIEQLKKIIVNQFNTNSKLAKWRAKILELDHKIQGVFDKILPNEGTATN